ncbi:MAG: hypothetical protein KJ990_12895 [Proteobacteria bacterium]|nr:hypothetical protein [Pseudomonadota bacterium]MBU1649750.1 hypothetical protein [Pseudomonadota bacterium]
MVARVATQSRPESEKKPAIQAYQTLEGHGQAHNLECLPCHVSFSPGIVLSKEQLLALPSTQQTAGL